METHCREGIVRDSAQYDSDWPSLIKPEQDAINQKLSAFRVQSCLELTIIQQAGGVPPFHKQRD